MSAFDDVEIELYAGVIDQTLSPQEEFSRELYDDAIMNCGVNVDDLESGGGGGDDDGTTKDLTPGDGEAEKRNSSEEGDIKAEAPPVRKAYRMCIGNLTWWTSDKIIKDTLADIGVTDLLDIKFISERVNGQSKGYCVVTVGSEESLRTIQDTLPRGKIEGNVPIVKPPTRLAIAELEAKAKTRSNGVNPWNLRDPNMNMMGPSWDHPNRHAAGYDPRMMGPGRPMRAGAVGPTSPPMMGAPPPPHRNMGPRQDLVEPNGFAPLPGPSLLGSPPQRMRYRNRMMMPQQRRPNMPPRGPPPPPPMMDPRRPPPGDWNMQGSPPPPPPRMINGPPPPLLPPGSLAPHFNPRFWSPPPGPPEYVPAPSAPPQQQAANYDILPPAENGTVTEAEFEEILSMNRAVSTTAIARAVKEAEAGDFAGAVETLETAISLIKQSKIAPDDRCKVLITVLEETLEGVKNETFGRRAMPGRARSGSRSRSRATYRRRSRRGTSRSRNRSRERNARNRSGSHRERRRERNRGREVEPPERSENRRPSRR